MIETQKQQILLELQNTLLRLQSAGIALTISQNQTGFAFCFNGVKENPLLLEFFTDLNDERIEINQENTAFNVQIPFDFMQSNKGVKIRQALPLLVTLQSLKNESKTTLTPSMSDKEPVVTKTLKMVKAIVNDNNCSLKAAALTFEAFHPPVKRIAQNKPLTPQEAKAFDERIHYAAREGRMAESTKSKILGAAFVISFALLVITTVALTVSFPMLFAPILIGGAVFAPMILLGGLAKAYEKFLGFSRDSDTPKKETIKAKDSIVNWGIFKDANKQLDKTSATTRAQAPSNPNDFGSTDALAASFML